MKHQMWMNQAKEHWKEFQPTRFNELKKNGQLETALEEAANLTYLELNQLENQGLQPHEAWEMVREKYLFLPEEPGLEDEETNPAAALLQEAMALNTRILQGVYDEET